MLTTLLHLNIKNYVIINLILYFFQVVVPDIPEIISLLQAIGYKVKYFDPANTEDIVPVKGGGGIRMIITCTHSGLRACLEAPSECHCPNSNNASFWEVTGSAPNSTQVTQHKHEEGNAGY